MTVLLVTEQSDLSADLVVLALRRRGADFVRLNMDTPPDQSIVSWVSHADDAMITVHGRTLDLRSVASAWFRRPIERPTSYAARETFVMFEGLCYFLDRALWVNAPLAIQRA